MRLLHLIAASLATLAFAASAATAETVSAGYVDAHYARVSTNGPDADVWGIAGAYSAPLGSTWGVQLNASWDNVDPNSSGGSFDTSSGTAHVFMRTADHLYGALAGVIDSNSTTTWGAGVEGDWYLDNSTIGGRVVYLRNDDADLDFWGVDAHYRFFVSDNLRLEANAGWGNADFTSTSVDVYTVGAEAEYRMSSVPLSVFGDVSYVNADTGSGNSDATIASIGVRWNFNQDSLKDRDRSGPSLKGLNSLLGASGSGGLLGLDL